jgi:hypothetical protein
MAIDRPPSLPYHTVQVTLTTSLDLISRLLYIILYCAVPGSVVTVTVTTALNNKARAPPPLQYSINTRIMLYRTGTLDYDYAYYTVPLSYCTIQCSSSRFLQYAHRRWQCVIF